MNISMERLISTTALVVFLVACGGNNPPSAGPTPLLSLDGIYRGSPVITSADGFTYDYEFESAGGFGWRTIGSVGRVYTTTVNPNNTIDGTATIYELGGTINTAALTGTITSAGAMSLHFVDGVNIVNIVTQRIPQASTTLGFRAWCTYAFDDITVYDCGEFDVLSRLVFRHPGFGPGGSGTGDIVTLSLGTEVTPDVYEATVDWEGCGSLSGLASFAVSEDGVFDELVITVVGGRCNFMWWLLRATQ